MTDRSRGGAARWPLGLIGMIGLVAGVESGVARHRQERFSTIVAEDWAQAIGRARRAKGAGVLCLGDSLIKYGVAPKILGTRLGMRAEGLATSMGQAPASYALLRRAIDAGARPRVVVVDFTEHLLAAGPRKNLRHWPEILGLGESMDLARAAGDGELFGELAAARLVPTIRARAEVRAALMAAFGGKAAGVAGLDRFRRNWGANGGAQIHPKIPQGTDPAAWFARVYPPDWRCMPVNWAYIERFLALAESRGIPVVWVIPPYSAGFQALCEANGVDGRFAAMVFRFKERHPGLVVVDGRRAGYPIEVYGGDPIHLDFEGANAFSEALATVVGRVLRGDRGVDRWVSLPEYRPSAIDASLEHLGRSIAAVEAEKAARLAAAAAGPATRR